jgi:two-component system response regulator YesN
MVIDTRDPVFSKYEKLMIEVLAKYLKESFFSVNISEYKELFFLVNIKMPTEISLKELGSYIQGKIQSTYQTEVFVLLGMPLQKIENISTVYSRLERLEEYRFFVNTGAVLIDKEQYVVSNRIDDAIDGIVNCTLEDIKYKEYAKAREDIQILVNTIKEAKRISNIFIRQIFVEIIRKIVKVGGYFNEEETLVMMKYILSAANIFDIQEYVLEKLFLLEENIVKQIKGEGNTEKLISDVVGIIRKEYNNPNISLEYLASKVYLSPNYLSAIFKNGKGETLNSFLVNYRMERAKELILSTNIKIGTIAEMVGFSSSGYFVTVFHNIVGVAPAKYRELNG